MDNIDTRPNLGHALQQATRLSERLSQETNSTRGLALVHQIRPELDTAQQALDDLWDFLVEAGPTDWVELLRECFGEGGGE